MKPPTPGPQSYHGAPNLSSYRPAATAVCRTEEARAPYVPRSEASLTVSSDGYVHLNAEAARLLPAGDGTLDLRPPVREGRGDCWQLDARAGGRFPRRPVGTTGGIKFRAATLVGKMLGCLAGPASFIIEPVGNDLFWLFPKTGNK